MVAERKVESLLEAGALVTVVSPEATPRLLEQSESGRIALRRRGFIASDMDGTSLVISATDDPATQQEVVSIARAKGVLVNTVDQPELCDFIVPAILRRGDVTLAISTSGKSPVLAAALRERLDHVLTDEVARAASVLGTVRKEVHERFADIDERKRVFESIVNSGIMEWIGGCDDAAALQRVRQIIDGIV